MKEGLIFVKKDKEGNYIMKKANIADEITEVMGALARVIGVVKMPLVYVSKWKLDYVDNQFVPKNKIK